MNNLKLLEDRIGRIHSIPKIKNEIRHDYERILSMFFWKEINLISIKRGIFLSKSPKDIISCDYFEKVHDTLIKEVCNKDIGGGEYEDYSRCVIFKYNDDKKFMFVRSGIAPKYLNGKRLIRESQILKECPSVQNILIEIWYLEGRMIDLKKQELENRIGDNIKCIVE